MADFDYWFWVKLDQFDSTPTDDKVTVRWKNEREAFLKEWGTQLYKDGMMEEFYALWSALNFSDAEILCAGADMEKSRVENRLSDSWK